jgi:hypothetical protein
MISNIENLWVELQEILTIFSETIVTNDCLLIKEIGRTPANNAFPLRGYLSFRTQVEADEVAVTVELHSADKKWSIESGIYWEDGFVISDGPSKEISYSADQLVIKSNFDAWIKEFREFLQSNRNTVISHLEANINKA